MNIKEHLAFIHACLADGSITEETIVTSRSGGYEQQHVAHVSVERGHNGIEYNDTNVFNVSADA